LRLAKKSFQKSLERVIVRAAGNNLEALIETEKFSAQVQEDIALNWIECNGDRE
jgi:hypothetical protein